MYDDLPIGVPTLVSEDDDTQTIVTRSAAGFAMEFVSKPGRESNLDRLRVLVPQALTQLQTIIDAPPATFSNLAQAQTQVRQLQDAVVFEARVLRRMIRLAFNLYDGTD